MTRTEHPSHVWGPHHRGLRLVECSACTVLLHEPEADRPCDPTGATVKAGRERRRVEQVAAMQRMVRAESGARPHRPASEGVGLLQHAYGLLRRRRR